MSTIGRYMTEAKYVVAPRDTLVKAKELMQLYQVRHLPVLDGPKVVGMVTLGDLYVMEAIVEADPDKTLVENAMSRELYIVGPDAPLSEVATEMARREVGSALVVENDRLAGIFTTTDACRVLGEVLKRQGA
jgi:acetoin utilization protein AcuB